MTVTRERFEQGMTYDAYKAQMTRNRDRLEANEQALELGAEDEAFFTTLTGPVYAIAITEDWCGDAINNLPILGRLAALSPALELRVFLRDQNPDLINLYLKEGKYQSIPVFAFFDADFKPIGHWIERPASISAKQEAALDELFANDPAFAGVARDASMATLPDAARDRIIRFFGEFRATVRAESDSEVVRELRELIAGATRQAGS